MQNTLGLTGRARGVKNEQRILGVHRRRRAIIGGLRHLLVIPVIAAGGPSNGVAGMAHHQHRFHASAALQRLIGIGLQRHRAATAQSFVGRDQDHAVGIENAVFQGVRRETAEHHRMHRADARAGQHRHQRLGNHRHVDRDPVTLGHAARLQDIGKAAHLAVQLAIGDVLVRRRIIAFPDDGNLLAARSEMAVQTVVGDIQSRAFEPADRGRVKVAIGDRVPALFPAHELVGLLGPELVGRRHRATIHIAILLLVDMRRRGDSGRDRTDFALGHGTALLLDCDPARASRGMAPTTAIRARTMRCGHPAARENRLWSLTPWAPPGAMPTA